MRTFQTTVGGRTPILALLFALTVTACSSHPTGLGFATPVVPSSVLLNGRAVAVSGGSVLHLMSHPYAGSVARAYVWTRRSEPVVLLDGVQLDRVDRLADVPVLHVASIVVLRPIEARLRYGPRAAHGAILVTTKGGPTR